MVEIVADLHLHSKYSRAVSPQMTLPMMAAIGKQKGLDLLATGDWTHPFWFAEIKHALTETEEGLYRLKKPLDEQNTTRFLLSVEIATMFSQQGKGRRVHQIVFVPSLETAEKVNKEFSKRGYTLSADGRPILGLSSKDLLTLLLEIDERSLLIPAHIWTPWFGIYGQLSGFTSLEEAFADMAPYVYGIETGLSSDPEMNWQVKELDTRSILSFSDAHSPAKMGREATVFQLESLTYENIREAIMKPSVFPHPELRRFGEASTESSVSASQKNVQEQVRNDNTNRVLYTVEFYPEEGKYHYSGHRKCGVFQTPDEQRSTKSICPVCKRKVTDGVMRRVEELANEPLLGVHKENAKEVVWIRDPKEKHPPFVKIVPLVEIIAQSLGRPVTSPKVKGIFDMLCLKGKSEIHVLLQLSPDEIAAIAYLVTTKDMAQKIAEGIEKVRGEDITIQPGYDGLYGVVKIWQDAKVDGKSSSQHTTQTTLEL